MHPNDPLKHLRDYNTPNGYVYAGIDAGREARGLIVGLIKFVFRIVRRIFSSN